MATGILTKIDLVKTHRRVVKQIVFNAWDDGLAAGGGDVITDYPDSAVGIIGITGSAFDPIGGSDGEKFVSSITGSTAKLSRISWSFTPTNVVGLYFLDSQYYVPEPTDAGLSLVLCGQEGEFNFEKMTLGQNGFLVDPMDSSYEPAGAIWLSDLGGEPITGVVRMEFVL